MTLALIAQVNFEGLVSETCYKAEVQFGNETVGVSAQATFYTAPAVDIMRPVRFAWSGDIAGQNICRDLELGFPIFNVLNEVEDLEFFINLGDAIYGEYSGSFAVEDWFKTVHSTEQRQMTMGQGGTLFQRSRGPYPNSI